LSVQRSELKCCAQEIENQPVGVQGELGLVMRKAEHEFE